MQDLLQTAAGTQWKIVGTHERHGIALPLFSLHSETSCGIGEYPDLLPLIPWCKEIGYSIIQLLPLNDTGPEASPYSAISAFALNPIHLGLSQLPDITPELVGLLKPLQSLSKSQRIDYKSVREGKEVFLKNYISLYGQKIKNSSAYRTFQENNPWLKPFALFKAMKILLKWSPWENWGPELRDPTIQTYENLCDQFEVEIEYHSLIQFLCFQQLEHVKEIANPSGILLKGDIPILISRESADVWLYGLYFLIYYSAGAPPDMYAKEGQNWGSPIYDWEALKKADYNWWRWRLKVAERIYNLYRIDHIVGFFRIFAIPEGQKAENGKYILEDKMYWIPQGESIMRLMLESSRMLPIGEDLGTVPDEVRTKLKELGICGTKVIRWERDWKGNKNFILPKDFIPESMTTVSTHDSETLQQWWINNPQEAKDFCQSRDWVYSTSLPKDKHYRILRESHQSGSLFHINLLNEYLALIPNMTWPQLKDERINTPGTVSEKNWTYRFLPSVEEIVSNKQLGQIMKDLIK